MSSIHTIVIDLDGTLMASDGSVSPRNRDAIARARDAGLTVMIATGRVLSESEAILDAIAHEGLLVAAGGSLLCEVPGGHGLDRRVVCPTVVASVVGVLSDHGHRTLILKDRAAAGYDYLLVGSHPLDPASEWWFSSLPVLVRHVEDPRDDPHPEDTLRAGAVAPPEAIEAVAARLRDDLVDRASFQHWTAVSPDGAGPHLLEVFGVAVNKWTMVGAWCARAGLDPAGVAAIGDGLNDVELVAGAGLGIAMGNADPRVLAVADRVTAGNDQDGVARAIGEILDGAKAES